MNKKEVRDKLISNYDNMYSHYKELMKKQFEVYDYEDYQKVKKIIETITI